MGNKQLENLFELLDDMKEHNIPDSEYWRFITEYLERKTRRLHIPHHGNYELTPLCNFNCKMCYVHLSEECFQKNTLLTLDRWKALTNAAQEAGMQDVTLTGGECLTYPEFDDLYVYLITSGLKVSLMSNGYLIDERRLGLFKEFKPSLIQISLYGSNDTRYEAVTGVRAFSRVYENIIRLREIEMPIKLAITPSVYMRGDIEALINLAESLNVKYGVNPLLMSPRENTGRIRQDLSVEEYLDVYRYLCMIHHDELEPSDWADVPKENHEGPQRYGIRCGAGRSTFDVRYDGKMCACLSLGDYVVDPFELGFAQAWKQINDYAEGYALPYECGECVYRHKCLSCVAIHKNAPVPGHCDPEVCERMRRLVKEGFIPLRTIC